VRQTVQDDGVGSGADLPPSNPVTMYHEGACP
jgi:hypothetical protein